MKTKNIKTNRGFTLIETMIAVFILVMAMNGLLGLIASSLFSARYAKNEMVANYLIQEAVDYIRNDRDTTVFQKNGGGTWATFQAKYSGANGCFTANGCDVEPAKDTVNVCSSSITFGTLPCKVMYYDENTTYNKDYYNYDNNVAHGLPLSNFKRQVYMTLNPLNSDELDIKVTVEWLNGSLTRSKVSRVSLLKWQP